MTKLMLNRSKPSASQHNSDHKKGTTYQQEAPRKISMQGCMLSDIPVGNRLISVPPLKNKKKKKKSLILLMVIIIKSVASRFYGLFNMFKERPFER